MLRRNEYEEYIPSAEEKMELSKENIIYDLIFQEFFGNKAYLKESVKIENNNLHSFLRKKELEFQKELFIQFTDIQLLNPKHPINSHTKSDVVI